ncbi:glutathione S-transferase 1-1-like [Anoplophora glabripennis]|uniref:Glutathione S-transferase n=1 Tax=Anoplophora glabripennis TaxID=217634 RepID=A0A8F8MZ99_ANOGL|nr:glutathione S-transferase 1-1-like [Anoplophora glabripennis]QYA72010.1 glutathione S-transferase [Anoplophora glabripennis]
MPIDFYYIIGSPPCTAVLLTAKAVGINLNLKLKEENKEHLLKINPQNTVPTIDDTGFVLWESRAIMQYLQNQYGTDASLYPTDPKERAIVDFMMYFDISTLYDRLYYYLLHVAFGFGYDPEKFVKLNEAFKLFDTMLSNSEHAAGNKLTLADLTLVATVSTSDFLGYDLTPYKNIVRWYTKVKEVAPGYEQITNKSRLAIKQQIDKINEK